MLENETLAEKTIETKVSWKDVRYQILTSNIAYMFTIHAGINLAFSNLLLNEFDETTISWFASIVALSSPLGALAAGPLMDKFGRRKATLAIGIPCVVTWLLIGFSRKEQIKLLYFSRFLAGFVGGLAITNIVYVSETTHKKYRPLFLALLGLYFSFGILLTTLLQVLFTWTDIAIIFAIFFTVVELLTVIFVPESPIWFMNFRSDFEGAKKSLKRLNPNVKVFEEVWQELRTRTNNFATKTRSRTHQWNEPAVYKPLFSLMLLFFLQQLSGLYPLVFYTELMFSVVSPTIGYKMKTGAFVMFGFVRFVASIVSCLLSFKIGRRKLLMSSSIGMLITAILLIICEMISKRESLMVQQLLESFSLILFINYLGLGSIGVMTIPWTLIAELLPTQKRGIGGAYLISYCYLNLFVLTKTFPFILEIFGVTIMFGIFIFASILLTIFVYYFIPETLGRTLQEIEAFYAKKSNKPNSIEEQSVVSIDLENA